MNSTWWRYCRFLIAVVPGIALTPSLATPLGVYRPGVELAQYFQTLALSRDGLASYTYLTPAESSGGAHIHSLLSTPLLAAGVRPAGRIVSAIAAVVAVYLLMVLVGRMVNKPTGVLAGGFLWLHPLFLRLASTWNPYILGITLTIGALFAAYNWLDTDTQMWFGVMLVILFIAVLNHTWEGSIALPLVVLLLLRHRYRAAGAVTLTVFAGVSLFFFLRTLQPQGHALIQSYSIVTQFDSFLSVEWLLWGRVGAWQPWRWLIVLAIPMTIGMIGFTGAGYARLRSETPLVLCSWLLSGLTILVLLPEGWIVHEYYAWALVAPLAASAAWVTKWMLDKMRATDGYARVNKIGRLGPSLQIVLAAMLIAGSMGYAVGVQADQMDRDWVPTEEGGYTNGPGHPTMAAGVQLSATDIESPERIVFVGPWTGRNNNHPPKSFIAPNGVLRTMIYSDVLVRQRHLADPNTPRFATNTAQVTDCDVMVIAEPETSTVDVKRCD